MLISNDGNTVIVKTNVVLKVMGYIKRLPDCLKNRFKIQKNFRLADTLPQKTGFSPTGVLIESDY